MNNKEIILLLCRILKKQINGYISFLFYNTELKKLVSMSKGWKLYTLISDNLSKENQFNIFIPKNVHEIPCLFLRGQANGKSQRNGKSRQTTFT